ncbi:polyprenyl diphosphate synthase [Candidatus Viridilinea mediisalina]|uniref:Isoprenyl transferase n=1 Tax=Candidatus Viridilinea mediisalina TaxID=2024553 RepID=A0A2A6RGR0_9CHLR|nr:polyprenyl diphosphate synthase [Candidatus Viridilinea mediisalina]PDW02123.1 di-trans,poly-cis-decaprenylcistransferase [Candidatus Viridilinea mediisalina]
MDNKLPKHLGLIMDGNGRWGQRQQRSRLFGHQVGLQHILTVLPICFRLGIPIVSGYLWSLENWRRPSAEVAHMRHLLRTLGPPLMRMLHAQHVRIVHSGNRAGLTPKELAIIDEAVTLTQYNGPHTFNIVFNYSGREELVHAARRIATERIDPAEISEQLVNAMLSTPMPDLDLVIRTSGECRLSNFLLWQSANAVLYVTDTSWPDFGQRDLEAALRYYQEALCMPAHVRAVAEGQEPYCV